MNEYEKQSIGRAAQEEIDRRQTAPLSGQQMQALAKNHADQLAAIKRDIELRKWAVDQACGLIGSQPESEAKDLMNPIGLARAIHAFLVEAVAEKAN